LAETMIDSTDEDAGSSEKHGETAMEGGVADA
jgi:hypothetical protein